VVGPRDYDVRVNGLVWDYEPGQNVDHIARHGVRQVDVEEVLALAPHFFLNNTPGSASHMMVGSNAEGRYLRAAIDETADPGVWYVVTAHWLSRRVGRKCTNRSRGGTGMPKRRPTYEEMARIEDEKVAQGREAEGLVRVNGEAGKADHIMMLRFTPEEIALVRQAAEANGIDVLQFVRDSVLGTASKRRSKKPALVKEVQEKVRELADAVEKL
jgi:uncharacterized protein (DUF1778 family)